MADHAYFLEHLRNLSLEEGQAYIQTYTATHSDHAAIGEFIADEAFRQRGIDPLVCLKLAELLIFFGEQVAHPPSHALGLKIKGDALHYIGYHQAALQTLDAAGEEFLWLQDEVGWAHSRISWIPSCAWLGHTEEALQAAARAHAIFLQRGEAFWACAVDINTAVIYKQTGQYQKALDLYERILEIYPTLSGLSETYIERATAIVKNNQAMNLSLLGHFEQASGLLQEAQTRFIALDEITCVITTEINLADLDYAQSYYGSALQRYYQARDFFRAHALDDPHLLTEIMLRLSACLVKLNRAREASQLAAEAVAIFKDMDTSLYTGDALREYATTLVASGNPEEALTVLEEAYVLFTQGGFEHQAATTRLQQAELLLVMDSFTPAYEQARTIKQYFDHQSLVACSVRASLVMVGTLIALAQQDSARREDQQAASLLGEATALCEEAISQAREHNLQEQVYKGHHLLGRLFLLQVNFARAADHFKAATDQIDAILDDLAYDLGPSFLRTAWIVYEDMIALCLQQDRSATAFGYLEHARSMALRQYLNQPGVALGMATVSTKAAHDAPPTAILPAQHELELREWQTKYRKYCAQLLEIESSLSATTDQAAIQAELKRCETKLSELFERLHFYRPSPLPSPSTRQPYPDKPERTDITELRRHLAPDQLLLAYFLYQGQLVIFALSNSGLFTHIRPDGASELKRMIPLLHLHLQPIGWRNPQQPPQHAIRGLLNKLYNLLVTPIASLLPPPSGTLTIVPYGPLHQLPFHALFNDDRFLIEDFQINYLPAASLLTRLGTTRADRSTTKPPLVFGHSGGRLPQALDEAKMLTTILHADCYLEDKATIAHLVEQAPGRPIIHLATHGQSRLDAPNFSSIRLADGQLNAIDAFRLNLAGCELVTLSGCETGLALIGGGDEQFGLGRAFLAAGASSLVMSLWPVEDNATNELMQRFYLHLLAGDSKAQALRTAQRNLLHRPEPMYSHPYFWAAFRFVGNADH